MNLFQEWQLPHLRGGIRALDDPKPDVPLEAEDPEEAWADESIPLNPVNHLMTHLPKDRRCEVCVQAKLYETPHRRRENQREAIRDARDVEEPSEYLEKVACDHIILRNEPGFRGECYSFVIVDRFTGYAGIFPLKSKTADEVESSFRKFCGRRRPGIVIVGSDRAPEILAAIRALGFNSEPSAPRQAIHNPFAESFIRTLTGMTASVLLQAGLSHEYWPLAHKYLEWSYSITAIANKESTKTCFEKVHGYAFEGFKVPFGALVWIKSEDQMSFEPKGEGALFLGAEITDGMKFKGLYLTWPLQNFLEKSFKQKVVRTLAVPPGPWRFPAKIGKPIEIEQPVQPGYLGDSKDSNVEQDIDWFIAEVEGLGEEMNKAFGVDSVYPAPGAGDGGASKAKASETLAPDSKSKESSSKPRSRAITKLRVAVHGPTKGCQACKEGLYSHTKECRERFNALLDEQEPKIVGHGAKDLTEAPIDGETEPLVGGVEPAEQVEVLEDDHEDSNDVAGLINIAHGSQISRESQELEKGKEVVAAILIDAAEEGEDEENLSFRYQEVCSRTPVTKPSKMKHQKEWFVEFCCASSSSCCTVAQQLNVDYLGLSEDFGDLLDHQVFEQVEYWFHERIQEGDKIHLFGSIPCGPFSKLQNLNLAVHGEKYQDYLQNERKKSISLVGKFHHLSHLAVLSGGSTSFEWPKGCSGWKEPVMLKYIADFILYASYPTGCGFDLTIKGKKPLKEWRVVTTSRRLAVELNRYTCPHTKNHKHDHLEGGGLASESGFYNLKMATVIVSSLCSETVLNAIPSMPTVGGVLAHEEKGLWMAQLVLALVHKPLSREEINRSPEAKRKLQEEAAEFRKIGVWDENKLYEVDTLISEAQKNQQKIHIAEIMGICHIKGAELPESQQQMKARLVFRGDDCKDAFGDKAIYKEMKSLPATVHSINMVLYHGMRPNNKVEISDATKAYLQAPLNSEVPTYAIIPKIIWKPEWHGKYRRVASRLNRAIYGHTISGDAWFEYFDHILTKKMKGKKIEEFPSIWHFKDWDVLVAAYVDDVIASGPRKGVDAFWKMIRGEIKFDKVCEPGRYLGRDHVIFDLGKGKTVCMSMVDYANSAVEMYESEFGLLKPVETPFVNESLLSIEGYEVKGHLAGKAAALLMKCLWLARLSRPDLSYAIVHLAGSISKWSRNHDVQIKRLLGYIKSTCQFGLWGAVPQSPEIPVLRLYCDADLAGDIMTCKSHSGIYLVLTSPEGDFFPLSWCSKRQTAVARSTTEAEIASVNEGVFSEGIPFKQVLEILWKRPVSTELMEDDSSDRI